MQQAFFQPIFYEALDIPPIPSNAIHIWRISLPEWLAHLDDLSKVLSIEEMARADRFRVEVPRQQYIIGRGLLKILLSRYIGGEVSGLHLRENAYGKPELATMEPISFNVAHSNALIMLAFALESPVGIDVEFIRPMNDMEQLITRFFSPAEVEQFQRIDPANRMTTFFRLWTRKEATIKALGLGLSQPLDKFNVPLGNLPDHGAKVVVNTDSTLRLYNINPDPAYAATVAAYGDSHALTFYELRL